MYNLKEFEQNYNDKHFALKVYTELETLFNQQRKRIKFKLNSYGTEYNIYCDIPQDYKITQYIGNYLLLKTLYENKLIPYGRLQFFFSCEGSLNFYNKMELKLISNVSIMYGKITTIHNNNVTITTQKSLNSS